MTNEGTKSKGNISGIKWAIFGLLLLSSHSFNYNKFSSTKMDSPTPKRPRILAPGSGTNDAAKYIDHLGTKISMNKIFKTLSHTSNFQIKDLPADPEALLAGIFQGCIDSALDNAKENNMEADQLGLIVSSELLHPDAYIPIRPITDNTCDAILNFFLKVAQSKAQEGINLWGKLFLIINLGNLGDSLGKIFSMSYLRNL
jgi:hypothetical protein